MANRFVFIFTLFAANAICCGQDLIIRGGGIRFKGGFVPADQSLVLTSKPKTNEEKDDGLSSYERVLVQKGVELSKAGIKKYLSDIHISSEQKVKATQLIALLGSEVYTVRRDATKELSLFPGMPIEEFELAKTSADPETRYRIEMVGRFLISSFGKTLSAAYQYISDKEITGLLPDVIRSQLFAKGNPDLNRDFLQALVATSTVDDNNQLRELIDNSAVSIQKTAVEALYRSQKKRVESLLESIAENDQKDDLVRLVAAESLADLGNRKSLATLVHLLDASDVTVRTKSGSVLQIATGVDHGYTGYSKAELRTVAVKKWKDWLASESSKVELRFPLEKFNDFDSYLNGHTLLACGYGNKVIELDVAGNEVWSVVAQGAWSAEKLENGNVLVACYNDGKVAEFNREKEIVWSHVCKSPLNARPLKNGNVLISEYSGNRVVEVNREKKEVWSYKASASVADAVRLKSGNTLVATQSKVVEVDPAGKVVWEYAANQAYGIQALKNGNIMISKYTPGQVIEVNRKKEIVWQYDCTNPTDAMPLANGNVLITENNRFIEVTRADKKIVWKKSGASCGAARR